MYFCSTTNYDAENFAQLKCFVVTKIIEALDSSCC